MVGVVGVWVCGWLGVWVSFGSVCLKGRKSVEGEYGFGVWDDVGGCWMGWVWMGWDRSTPMKAIVVHFL